MNIVKKISVLLFLFITISLQAQPNYYFSGSDKFDPKIPTPEAFLGYPIGSHFTRYDKIVEYFKELSRLSDKVKFSVIGKTHEERDLVILTITSPENSSRLEEIRKEHLTLVDPTKPEPDYDKLPAVVYLGYGVHGNETSSGEAALLAAYYLVASQNTEVQNYLKQIVVHIDPAQNPDGRDHAANWHNSWKSFPPVADPFDEEHNETWPGARGNHYSINLNRDWLSLVAPESQARVAFYHQWYPNIFDDYHEMGANSTYYFEPSRPIGTWNPITPNSTYEKLNVILANHFSQALDNIGSLYFTKEQFDNIAPIYGSTYPDITGGVGTTLEQGSSRGLVQETKTGNLTFPFTIRNQFVTSIATIKAAYDERATLLKHQKDFFKSAIDLAKSNSTKGYLFGNVADQSLTQKFLDLLLQHRIEVYALQKSHSINGKNFEPEYSYVVPAQQSQYRLVHSIFEENTSFKDSTFMDITAWSLVHAYGIQYAKIKDDFFNKGDQVLRIKELNGDIVNGSSKYAYILDWTELNSYKALYSLTHLGLNTKTAFKPFTTKIGNKLQEFGYGSVVIPVAGQKIDSDSLYKVISKVSAYAKVRFYSVNTGLSLNGIDLGSENIKLVREPKVAILTGQGISSTEAGEAWFVLNQYIGIPATKLNINILDRADLSKYNTLVLAGGTYNYLGKNDEKKIKEWVSAGNVLITFDDASEWVIKQGIVNENLIDTVKVQLVNERADFVRANEKEGAKRLSGSIFSLDLDITNPIGFGFKNRNIFVLREGLTLLKPTKSPYGTVAKYTSSPLINGYVSKENISKIRNTAAIDYVNVGAGTVVLFSDNPNFRATWIETSRLFLNSVLFGNHLSRGGRYF
nr:M14 family zinc carboxypeptidase [uncultured Bacteroides sp.]